MFLMQSFIYEISPQGMLRISALGPKAQGLTEFFFVFDAEFLIIMGLIGISPQGKLRNSAQGPKAQGLK